jgi:hypothetical protein
MGFIGYVKPESVRQRVYAQIGGNWDTSILKRMPPTKRANLSDLIITIDEYLRNNHIELDDEEYINFCCSVQKETTSVVGDTIREITSNQAHDIALKWCLHTRCKNE